MPPEIGVLKFMTSFISSWIGNQGEGIFAQKEVLEVAGEPRKCCSDSVISEPLVMTVGDGILSGQPAVPKTVLEERLLVKLRRSLAVFSAIVGADPASVTSDVLTVLSSRFRLRSLQTKGKDGIP